MEKKELIQFLDEIFKPFSFKKKGNKWRTENDYLEKLIILQKSKHSNSFYLNYGYVIKELELQNLEMHIFNQLSSMNDTDNKRIMHLLDLENNISNDERKKELKKYIESEMLNKLKQTNTKNDLLEELQNRSHLNAVPLTIKKYFNLNE